MDEAPLVAVVIPTHYRNDRLAAAIESVRAQTYDPIEIVVVDDSGECHAEPVAEAYDVPYLGFDRNRGANVARTVGTRETGGRYIQYLDDDDRLHPRKLERQVELLEAVSRPTGREYPPWEDRFDLFGSVRAGDWDRRPPDVDPDRHPSVRVYGGERLRETTLYRSLAAHFREGRTWERTELVGTIEDALADSHRVWHGCGDREAVLDRCEALDTLHESMRRDGFRSQLVLASDGEIEPAGRLFPTVTQNEVAIDIGRDGTPLLVEGKHRFAVADILGIERIPAVVYVRHADWMNRRDGATGQPRADRSVADSQTLDENPLRSEA